jgi:hypothetical protein
MSISYTNPSTQNKLREPLLRRIRAYYRGPRKSSQENLIADQIYVDIQRIYYELEQINIDILNKVKLILDKEQDDSFTNLESDGSRSIPFDSDIIGGIVFHGDWKDSGSHTEYSSAPTIDSLASRLARVQHKLNRIEKQ